MIKESVFARKGEILAFRALEIPSWMTIITTSSTY